MPQPLSRVNRDANVLIGNAGDRPLERHAQLAAVALEAIASWSNVEAFLLRLFVQVLGGDQSLATAVYLALEGQAAKSAAIRAAAALALRSQAGTLAVLDALLAIAKTNEKERNRLAHWAWGDSPDLPDALLLYDPRTNLADVNRDEVFVYREQDFRLIIQANDRLCSYGHRLKFVLQGHSSNRDGKVLAGLHAEPEIAERIARQAERAARP